MEVGFPVSEEKLIQDAERHFLRIVGAWKHSCPSHQQDSAAWNDPPRCVPGRSRLGSWEKK